MSECDEVAAAMFDRYFEWIETNNQYPIDMQTARDFVRSVMPGESEVVIDNVAESLNRRTRG